VEYDITFTHKPAEVFTQLVGFGKEAIENSLFAILRSDGKEEIHACISTQLGCAYSCRFCTSGLNGLSRNLSKDEIISSIRVMEEKAAQTYPHFGGKFDRIDFMGSGEFLSNPAWKQVLMEMPEYGNKVSIACVGSASKIQKLAESGCNIHSFWLSLHGVRDETRSLLLPVAKRFPVKELIDATVSVRDSLGCKVRVNYLTYDFNTTYRDAEKLTAELGPTGLTLQLSEPNGSLVEGSLSKEKMILFSKVLREVGFSNRIVLFSSAKAEDSQGGCGMLRYIT